jgi:hypothetical protein
MFYKLILLALTLAASHAAVLQHGILAASDTTGTNATVRSVTITSQTNLNAGVLNATNDLKRAGVTIFNATATVIPALNASGTFIDSAFSFVPDGTDGVINLFTDTDNDTADTAMIVQPYSTSAYGNAHIALIVENNVETPASTTFPVNAAREGNNAIYGLSAAPNTNTVAVGVIGAVDPAKFNYSIGVEGIVEVATSHAASTNFGVVASADLPASDASRKTMPLFARAFRTASPDVPVAENAILLLDSYDTGYPLIIARTNNGTTAFKVEAASGYAGGGTLFLSDDGTYKAAGGGAIANTVLGSGTTAANDIAVFTDTTHTNIARSTSAGRLGDNSSATYTLTIDGSGTDAALTFGDNSITTTNQLILTDATSPLKISTDDNQFELGSDPTRAPTVPVATFRPTTTNSVMIIDLQPSSSVRGGVTNDLGTGACWIDMTDIDLKSNPSADWKAARFGIATNGNLLLQATAKPGGALLPGSVTITGSGFSINRNTTGGAAASTWLTGDSTALYAWTGLRFITDNTYPIGAGGYRPSAVTVGTGGITSAGTLTLTPAAADTTALTGNGYSVTGSGTTTGYSFTGTWNSSGSPVLIDAHVTNTASGADALMQRWRVSGVNKAFINKSGDAMFNLRATPAVAGTIASATTIAPTAPITFISGTDAIETITAPAPISATGGQITLIPTGIFTTTTAGNIALATTAVVSKALIMTYDQATAKWYPSY